MIKRRSFVFALLACLALLGCKEEDDITQIRKLGIHAVKRAEAKDINAVMEVVTKDFSVSPGNHKEQGVRPILLMLFRQYGKFRILHPEFDIELTGPTSAKLVTPFFMLREGQKVNELDLAGMMNNPVEWAQRMSDDVGDPYTIEAKLIKTDEGWKVQHVSVMGFKRLQDIR